MQHPSFIILRIPIFRRLPRIVQKNSNTCRGRSSEHYHCCRSLLCLWHYTPCSFVRYSSAVSISLSPPMYAIRSLPPWAKENGFCLIHHGGGRTNDANDNLYGLRSSLECVLLEFSVERRFGMKPYIGGCALNGGFQSAKL